MMDLLKKDWKTNAQTLYLGLQIGDWSFDVLHNSSRWSKATILMFFSTFEQKQKIQTLLTLEKLNISFKQK
jgi:hypothetical protein